jgi:16S rRNA (cytidine1402-2'-O)-methyltransferase
MAGKLSIVATPIGNLEDITLRAIRILKESDVILCEDTRKTRGLLDKYEIKTKMESYSSDDLSKGEMSGKLNRIIESLENGFNISLVTDAGTPGVSDPGALLVSRIIEVLPEVKIEAIPGASALTAFLSVAGMPVASFHFLGFLPHKKGRETLFKEMLESEKTTIFFESSHRIMKTLESLNEKMPDRKIVVGRELTKIYEEVVRGEVKQVFEFFKNNEEKIRGEFVVGVWGKS